MTEISIYNVAGIGAPAGQFSHVARVRAASEYLFIAGMVATDAQGQPVGADDFDVQADQVFANVSAALASAGAAWTHVVQFTTYITRADDVGPWRRYRQRRFAQWYPDGRYPPNTLLVVDRLASPEYLVEVQTIAAI